MKDLDARKEQLKTRYKEKLGKEWQSSRKIH
jgi:hypothetical protein